MKNIFLFFAVLGLILLAGCYRFSKQNGQTPYNAEKTVEENWEKGTNGEKFSIQDAEEFNDDTSVKRRSNDGTSENRENIDDISSGRTEKTDSLLSSEESADFDQAEKYLVVIDPGHQKEQNTGKEPVGPGSSDMKQKVSSGTSGVSTGLDEYELNLEVSLKLRDELTKRGYEVIMVRETNDVDISNAERAEIANKNHADVFVRIHANGDDDQSMNGMLTICQTPDNPYNGDLYLKSRALAEDILDRATKATGAKRLYVWETDTMSGINWAKVPCTIVEMGYMSNPAEDEKMSTDVYQAQIVKGISDGIDHFLDRAGS